MEERKGRITASMIGNIYRRRDSTNPSKLVDQIRQTNYADLSHIPAIRHGRKFESAAKAYYEIQHKVIVQERGLMLHPEHHWLGASTDGYIPGPPSQVLEIKCPIAGSDLDMLIDIIREKKAKWFLVMYGNSVRLNKNHAYYFQCQIQMACLEVDQCVFFVYLCTSDGLYLDSHSEIVYKDPVLLAQLVGKAKRFFDDFLT